jgi:hypothetical protein
MTFSLATLASNTFHRIEAFFTDEEKIVLPILEAAGKQILANGGPILLDAAMSAVGVAEKTSGTGVEKLAAATAEVVGVLKEKGVPVVMNAVNVAIEGSVAALRAQLPASTSAP